MNTKVFEMICDCPYNEHWIEMFGAHPMAPSDTSQWKMNLSILTKHDYCKVGRCEVITASAIGISLRAIASNLRFLIPWTEVVEVRDDAFRYDDEGYIARSNYYSKDVWESLKIGPTGCNCHAFDTSPVTH